MKDILKQIRDDLENNIISRYQELKSNIDKSIEDPLLEQNLPGKLDEFLNGLAQLRTKNLKIDETLKNLREKYKN